MSFHARKLLACSSRAMIDPYWNDVAMLIHGDGLVNATNLLYLDSSLMSNTLTSATGANHGIQGSFSPFPLSGAYVPTIHGGSNYFGWDATIPSCINTTSVNTRFYFLTGTFTIEFWVYFKSVSGTQTIVTNATTTSGWSVVLDGGVIKVGLSGPGYDLVGTTAISPNTWYHVAVSGITGTNKLFVNGTTESTFSGSTSFTGTVVRMGLSNAATNKLQAYLSNLRITQTQVYASDFTRPTSPVTLTANGGASPSSLPSGSSSTVPLLCNFTNAAIFDQTKKNNILLTGQAQRNTSQSRFGSASLRITSGTAADGLAITPSVENFNFGSGDFTIESWVYLIQYRADSKTWLFGGGNATTRVEISYNALGRISVATGTGSTISTTSNAVPLNTWTFVSIVRSGNTFTTYINGIDSASATYTGTISFTSPNQLGLGVLGGTPTPCLLGYLDDIRVTLAARYVANFTPPTSPFPNY